MKKLSSVAGGANLEQLPVKKVWFAHLVDPSSEDVESLVFVQVVGHWCASQDSHADYCGHSGITNRSLSINPTIIDIIEPIAGGTLLWLTDHTKAFFVPDAVAPMRSVEPQTDPPARAKA